MIRNTLDDFNWWSEIVDYESDETTVTLIDENDNKIIEFNFPKFTYSDFINFKKQTNKYA